MGSTTRMLSFWVLIICLSWGQYTAYYGNLHSHTSHSDGVGTPAEAFEYARNVAHLDFLAVTDHLEMMFYQPWEWTDCKNAANLANEDGAFVAIAGYEWSSPVFNHCNVFNTSDLVSPTTHSDLSAFYQYVIDRWPVGFAQFNHPDEAGIPIPNNWNWFHYAGLSADSAFPLIEIKFFSADSFYRMALDSGWHIAPANNQDNHSADWGTANDRRTGVWATALTRSAIFEAIKARRVFSTQDKNARVWISIGSTDMGSTVSRTYNMPLYIRLEDPDGEIFSTVEIVASGGVNFLSLSNHPSPLETTIYITPHISKWLYLMAMESDGQWIWSAPIFISGPTLFVEENQVQPGTLLVIPNPARRVVDIYMYSSSDRDFQSETHLKIFDISGIDVTNRVRKISPTSLDISDLPVGIYVLKLCGTSTKMLKIE